MSSCTQPCAIPQYTGQTLDTISLSEVQALQGNLNQWLAQCSDKCPALREDNNVWFSMESLTNYLSYAQHRASGLTQVPEISGIRLYLGKDANNALTIVASATYKPNGAQGGNRTNDPDLGFGVLNYGQAGYPPKKDYPH